MSQKILFIKPANSTFIVKDESFLAAQYDLKSFFYGYGNALRHVRSTLALACWLLRNIAGANVVFVWFADYHSWLPILLARLLGKKSLLILGGYDVACVPELNYGVFVRPFRGWCARRSMRNATYLLPVTRAMLPDIALHAGRIFGTVTPAPTGYSTAMWFPHGKKEEKMALTVAFGTDLVRLQIKGLDLYAQAGRELPDYRFVLVGLQGAAREHLAQFGIANLELVGPLPVEQLREYYQKANVYLQLSLHEGLPNAVLEAMLCECVPVGSPVGGIPEAMGPVGFLISDRTPAAVADAVRRAAAEAPALRARARQYAQDHFSETVRQETWRDLIDGHSTKGK